MKTTVIHHSADYDGIFCREIARKFLPDAELIGWDFKDGPLPIPPEGQIYILDLPVDRVFGMKFGEEGHQRWLERAIWIDHHKSSIDSHPTNIPGYRIDGVAACRLAWQWFTHDFGPNNPRCHPTDYDLPQKEHFVAREVSEPIAVRLAGEYDVWDHRSDGDVEFQFGLDAVSPSELDYTRLLEIGERPEARVRELVRKGGYAMRCYAKRDADILRSRSFLVDFEGLKFLALNTARCNSLTFTARDVPETGHDALMGFYFDGQKWNVSLYHAKHRTDLDLSKIAVKFGGGGHRGACGFATNQPQPTTTTIPAISTMNITKITIGRLYNLGSYEHVRYELTAEVPQGESPATAMLGLEKIIAALSPKTHTKTRPELEREKFRLDEMHRKLSDEGPDEFRRYHGYFEGTPEEYIARCEESHRKDVAERNAWEARSAKSRKLLEDLGGAANWKDAKLDWENDDDFDA